MTSCSATASGSFYVDNNTLSGIYDYYHAYAVIGMTGFDNSTGCMSYSPYIPSGAPTGTQSLILQNVITSSTSFATKSVYYSDTACSSEIASMVVGYDEVSIGDNVTGLTTSIGNFTYPSSASKVTYKESCMEVKGTTDVGTAYLNTLLSSSISLVSFPSTSIISKINLVLERCFKNWNPKPIPFEAPVIRPGISEITKLLSEL